MKRILFSSLFLLLAFLGQAQDYTQIVRGTVIDKDTKQPLIGATVMVINDTKNYGATTDENGKFKIEKVHLGRKTVKVTYLGYEDRVLSDVIVNSAKEVILNIELLEKVMQAQEVVVSAKSNKAQANNDLILVSGRSFTIDQAQRYAGGFGDPSRMASSFAGVAGGGNDQRNDIIIRGNSPMGLLWRFEGADIPNPNHFGSQGANGGPVSILNSNMLANSDFMTGAFPSEYGNANSGVFDLKMRAGNNEKREFIGQIGFSGLELLAEGPINKSKGSSYIASYRYSTLSFFDAMGIKFGASGIPAYQDLSFKFNFPQTKLGAISFFGMGGISATKLLDSKKDATEFNKLSWPLDVDYASKMGVLGLSHSVMMGKKSYIKTVLSASGESNTARVDTLDYNKNSFYYINRYTGNTRLSLHSYYNKKFNAQHALKIGIIESRLGGNMNDSMYVNELGRYFTRLDFDKSTYLSQTYVNYNYRVTENLTLNGGLHFNYLVLNNTTSLDPRASIRYQINPKQAISFGYGKHGQTQPLITYYTQTLVDTLNQVYAETNKKLGMSQAHHFVVGYDFMVTENTRIKAEAYYQNLSKLPVSINPSYFSTINFGADFIPVYQDSLVNKGKGYNYGLELTVERFFNKGYYYLATASLYQSKYQGSDMVWRNTAFNGNFVLNGLAGKEWKVGGNKNNVLAFSLKVTYSGGRRFIPIDETASKQNGYAVYDEKNAYKDRQQDYFRTDIKISFKKNSKRFTQEWALDIQNVFNTQNILNQTWNTKTLSMDTNYQIGLFPVPFYRIYF
ncbi:MAG: TonB-dependent receptor [Bacteroidetes bacterium B1(2017)]|nr:MAG: TonB-dependent receptor [Bacteroidetes bacterium B1(2017)]